MWRWILNKKIEVHGAGGIHLWQYSSLPLYVVVVNPVRNSGGGGGAPKRRPPLSTQDFEPRSVYVSTP